MIPTRTLAVLLVTLLIAGCAREEQARSRSYSPTATSTKADCSPHRWSYSLMDYSMLAIDVLDAPKSFELSSSSVSLENAESQRARVTSKADEALRELNKLDRKADSWKASDRLCFGKGDHGKKVANRYRRIKEKIVEQKQAVNLKLAEFLAQQEAVTQERTHFERWRTENRELLVRNVGGMKLEIVRIAKRGSFNLPASVFTVEATNTTNSKILKPQNHKVWGYEFGSEIGGTYAIGASLTDSFGNDYKLTSIYPKFLGNEGRGIRPGETVTFNLSFGDVPLENAKSSRLVIDSATLGQQGRTVFELPSETIYGAAK